MIKLENTQIVGLEPAIRGMRNPMNSWEKLDSFWTQKRYSAKEACKRMDDGLGLEEVYIVGPNDHDLMMRLAQGGPVHAKYRRMIAVYVDITAPLYWWKEFETYRAGVTPNPLDIEINSCSTMHKIHAKEFTFDDFSHEHLIMDEPIPTRIYSPFGMLEVTVQNLNYLRDLFLKTGDKKWWWQMIQLLPSSYNQKRTVMLNYEALSGIYPMRREHKLDEWREFCRWIEGLPYSEVIIGEREDNI